MMTLAQLMLLWFPDGSSDRTQNLTFPFTLRGTRQRAE
jgi:hypothetical protein